MPTLPTDLRNRLERVVVEARDVAEVGARAALEGLAVHHHEPYPHMKPRERELRNHLRARARQLGDRQDKSGRLAIDHLVNECAYEHWHRMLFARFLAENGLLIEPESGVAITLEEAEELAREEGGRRKAEGGKAEGGKADVWDYVSRCAQRMLPQIFRPDDPLLQVSFATEHRVKLEGLLASLPADVFTASDALGWCYQFWQSKKKDQVNRSEVKIGADELPAVTQLFTEPYMVEFLLHNTLGAWWAGKKLKEEGGRLKAEWEQCQTEEDCRRLLALPGVTWDYLRFVKAEQKPESETSAFRLSPSAFIPAAGTFDGWPRAVKDIKVLDPCCGSGHFLVAALHHLVPIRMAEEGLSAAEAVDAVLCDNLHGLEIDERCCQIAAFALALAAWTYPEAGGYRPLPELNIACTGIGPQCSEDEWVRLAEQSDIPMPAVGREAIKNGLLNLHRLFSQAPTLGSLIDPTELPRDLIAADFETIQPYVTAIMKAEKADDETRERAVAAAGMVKAADVLACEYTLVITNVPYLGRPKQEDWLKSYADEYHRAARADLATIFFDRTFAWLPTSGTTAAVTPQTWLFLSGYRKLREKLLDNETWNLAARLGPGAFETIGGHVVNVVLLIVSHGRCADSHAMSVLDGAPGQSPQAKADLLKDDTSSLLQIRQDQQRRNPDSRVIFELSTGGKLLARYASSVQGLATHDDAQFLLEHWELPHIANGWIGLSSTVAETVTYGGRTRVLHWCDGGGRYLRHAMALKAEKRLGGWKSGGEAWGKDGVLISQVGDLRACIHNGDMFDHGASVIVPNDSSHLAAIWSFCSSDEYNRAVRTIDQKLYVTNATLVKVPFDLTYWQKVAAEKYPDGLPEPESDDPTQWLFHGHPYEAQEDTILQVAVARLLGYRWPAELDPDMRLSKRARELVKECEKLLRFADDDGIVCIPAVRGEEPATEQLLALLTACDIEPGVDLDDWLRNGFFEEHCKLFHDRPFVWHIWDGRKRDGFHALVNYHRLCERSGKGRRLLESLTYAYLGEWITRQKDSVKRGEGGAEDRLTAALELQKRLESILAGEPPFDIFVRWKPLHEQPIGWEPDINDGVRMNIRPFLASDLPGGRTGAGVLRYKPNIKWTKDRGKEPQRPKAEYPWFWGWDEKTEDFLGGKTFDGNRWNDCHYTAKVKQAARGAAMKRSK